MMAGQVRHAQITMKHGLDKLIICKHVVQTSPMREWSAALSQLCISPISYSPGRGLPELLQGKMALTRSSLRLIRR